MSHTYNYSLSSDFGGTIKPYQFHKEIENEGNITATLTGIKKHADDIEIIFQSELTGSEVTELNTLIGNHTPVPDELVTHHVSLIPRLGSYKSDKYTLAGRYIYPGSNLIDPLMKIQVSSKMDSGATSYSIRVRDSKNNQTIAERTFTNTMEEIVDLGELSNIPTEGTTIEFHIKRNGGGKKNKIYVEAITMHLGRLIN